MTNLLSGSNSSLPCHQLASLTTLAKQLIQSVQQCEQFGLNFAQAICSQELAPNISIFAKATLLKESCALSTGKQLGEAFTEASYRDFVASVISLLLNVTLVASQAQQRLPKALIIGLIDKQKHLAECPVAMTPLRPVKFQMPSLFEEGCTPLIGNLHQDWRARLKSDLETQDAYQRDFLIHSVTQICHELEARCENIEEPLRLERQKLTQAQEKVQTLQSDITSLELKIGDQQRFIDGLEQEYEQERSQLEEERDKASVALQDLSAEYNAAKAQWNLTLEAAKIEEHRLCTEVAEYQVTLRSQCEQHGNLEKTYQSLKDETRVLHGHNKDWEDKYVSLEANYHALEYTLETQRHFASEQTQKIMDLEHGKEEFKDKVARMEEDCLATKHEYSNLQFRHKDLIKSTEDRFHELEKGHKQEIENITTKVGLCTWTELSTHQADT